MWIWISLLVLVSLSLLGGEFFDTTEVFFQRHALVVLLVVMGLLYMMYKEKNR